MTFPLQKAIESTYYKYMCFLHEIGVGVLFCEVSANYKLITKNSGAKLAAANTVIDTCGTSKRCRAAMEINRRPGIPYWNAPFREIGREVLDGHKRDSSFLSCAEGREYRLPSAPCYKRSPAVQGWSA